MPIHRVMSSKDEYGKNDDTGAGLLTFGLSRDKRRAYKCALREIEGAYEKGKEPSVKGLAEAKDFGKKKRKADEEAPEDIKAVPADEMAALVFKMKTYTARRALRAQPSRVLTVSTWAPAYFEAVLTRDFYSAHLRDGSRPAPKLTSLASGRGRWMTDNDVTAAALYQHGAVLVPHVFEL